MCREWKVYASQTALEFLLPAFLACLPSRRAACCGHSDPSPNTSERTGMSLSLAAFGINVESYAHGMSLLSHAEVGVRLR